MRHARKLFVLVTMLITIAALDVSPASATSTVQIGSYVAIGDSYSAGFGIPWTGYAGGCYRSNHDYPSILAYGLKPTTFHDVTCSGAKPSNTLTAQHAAVAPQFDALDADTGLVTVGLGANEGGMFGGLVSACPALRYRNLAGHPCEDAAQTASGDAFYALADAAGESVRTVLEGIHERAPHARVVVVGYPRLAPDTGTCAALPLAAGDYAYVNSVIHRLDDDLAATAQAEQADCIDMWSASRGHDICSRSPWVQGSVDANHLAGRYHPFVTEQWAVAIRVARLLADG
ncbi:MAG TPA: SGNH/GDSL hydrolase family protein [Marmoricola sp.]